MMQRPPNYRCSASQLCRFLFPILLEILTLAPMRGAVLRINSLVVTAGADFSIRHAGTESFVRAKPGTEIINGDAVRPGAHDALLLGCMDTAAGSLDATYSLPAGAEVRFSSNSIPAPALTISAKQSPCSLPIDDRALSANLDDARLRTLNGRWEDRLPLLSKPAQDQLLLLLRSVEETLRSNPKELAALVARARYLEQAGLIGDAIRAYLDVYQIYDDAAWAARSASRLTAQLLPETDVAKAVIAPSSTGTNPDLHARRARGDAAPTQQGVIAPQGEVYALLVGISKYPPGVAIEDLHYAEGDAELFQKYLESARGGRVRNIKLIRSNNGTASEIRRGLEELVAGHASTNNTLIIFIAAHGYYGCVDEHGMPSPPGCPDIQTEPFILTTDTSAEAARSTGLPMREFDRLISQNAYRFGRVLVYVDVCHSGVIPWLHERTAPPPDAILMNFQPRLGVLGLMMASSPNQNNHELEYAYESDQLGHGIFTYYVLAGLAGAAPATGNFILFSDLFQHVSEQVRRVTEGDQVPAGSPTSQRLAVADNVAATDFSVPPPESNEKAIKRRSRSGRRESWASPLPVARSEVSQAASEGTDEARFEAALRAGRLLPGEENSAWTIYQHLSQPSAAIRDRLRVALEDAGQQIILQYLQGDQVPQTKPMFQRGAQLFGAAVELAPGTASNQSRRLFCHGRALIFDKQYGAAGEALATAIRLDPTRGYAYNGLGIAFLEQLPNHPEFLEAAINAFRDANNLEPRWAYPLHNLALAYAQKGDNERAIETYRAAMRIAPAYSYLPYNLGLLHERLNQAELAEKNFRLAVTRADVRAQRLGISGKGGVERAAPLNALSTLYLNEGRRRLAGKQLDAALTADPTYVPALHNKGILLAAMGRRKEAILKWREALSLDAEYLPARISLAEALATAGDYDHAAYEYWEILTRKPHYTAAHRALALVLVSLGRFQAGAEELNRAVAESPGFTEAAVERDDLTRVLAGQAPSTRAIKKALEAREPR